MRQEFDDTVGRSDTSADGDEVWVDRLVNQMIATAAQSCATEIHLKPLVDKIALQFLIEGQLEDRDSIPLRFFCSIVDRLRSLAKLTLPKDGQAQEGRFNIIVDSQKVKVDVCITMSGDSVESIKMTIHPRSQGRVKGSRKSKVREQFWT